MRSLGTAFIAVRVHQLVLQLVLLTMIRYFHVISVTCFRAENQHLFSRRVNRSTTDIEHFLDSRTELPQAIS